MKTDELIAAALKDPKTSGITLFWDSRRRNPGPAYRAGDEGGALKLLRWEGDSTGMHLEDFFRGPDGAYLGPDTDGVYPILIS